MTQRLSFSEKLLSIATRVRPGEGFSTWLLIANAFFLLYSHYLLKVARDTLILSNGSALDKSLANALSAVAVGIVVFIYTGFYKKFRDKPKRYLLTVLVNSFFFINILVFLGLIAVDVRTPMVFYIWQSIYGVLLVSHFWSYCADLMNQKTGQRLFPPIMVGATLGAWFGSYSADWVYNHSGVISVLFAALVCLLIATWLSRVAEPKLPQDSKNILLESTQEQEKFSLAEGFRLILSKRYLLFVAVFVILMNWINSTGEFIFASYLKEAASNAIAANPLLNEDEVIANYYSSYYTWISLLGFLLQTFLVSRLFRWIGIKGSVLVLPVVMILGYGVLAAIPLFFVARISMVVENSTSYSIANTTRNALYLPLDRNDKYLGKTTIDTFCWRLGDLMQFAAIFAGLNWLSWQTMDFVWMNLALSVVMLLVCMEIARCYKQRNQEMHSGNAPVVVGKVPSFELESGKTMEGKIPEDLFYDPDPGDAFRYFLTTHDDSRLPDWIAFDRHNLLISFSPPAGEAGELQLKLKVTDADELSCEAEIHVSWA